MFSCSRCVVFCTSHAFAGVWGFHSESAYTFQDGQVLKQESTEAQTLFEAPYAQDLESDIPRYGLPWWHCVNRPEEADAVLSALVAQHEDASVFVSWVKTAIAMKSNALAKTVRAGYVPPT